MRHSAEMLIKQEALAKCFIGIKAKRWMLYFHFAQLK